MTDDRSGTDCVVQAPITSFVIVSEMVDNHRLLVPLMAAALIAAATSKLICREGVYHALSKRYLEPMGDCRSQFCSAATSSGIREIR